MRILLALAFAATLAAQTFIQMTDPQFGMYAENRGFAQETANFEFAVATANRLKPAFVVVTGDLVNAAGDAAQIAEFKRVAGRLDPSIRLFLMPGNHDLGNEPTKESLANYREQFGPDYYTFRVGDITGIALNSNLEKGARNVPEEAAKMEAWFRTELAKARRDKHVIVFQHIPFFLQDANEADRYENIPRETRQRYLKILHEYGIKQVFAGHYHSTSEARDGDLEMITTGPVGKPVPPARSGLRIVTVSAAGVTHQYYDFGDLP
ncbi:MAG: metallophosphoesterase [Bryobacteraceae bacterium]|jgi:3',5'-cyclic AMP phosphodiesterase CpdA